MLSGSSAPVCLENLSVELLRMICAQLCWHCCGLMHDDTADLIECRNALMALSAASRRMMVIAQPFIYHYVPGNDRARPRLWPFIRTLNSRPDLAASVKWLGPIMDDRPIYDAAAFKQCKAIALKQQLSLENDPDFKVLMEAIDPTSTRETGDRDLLRKFLGELIISMLVGLEMLCDSVETDDVYMSTVETACLFLSSRFKRLRARPGLGALRALKLIASTESFFWALAPGISVLLHAAPHLERLRFESCLGLRGSDDSGGDPDSDEDEEDIYCRRPEPFNVRTYMPVMESLRVLSFVETLINDHETSSEFGHLTSMIRRCPQLEEFQFRALHPAPEYLEADDTEANIRHHRLIEALEPAHESLRVLDLYIGGAPEAATIPKIGSLLSQFKCLEVLKLDELAFCQHLSTEAYPSYKTTCIVEMLPLTVRRLHLRLIQSSLAWEDTAHLAAVVSTGAFPALSAIRIYVQHVDTMVEQERVMVSERVLSDSQRLFDILLDTNLSLSVSACLDSKKDGIYTDNEPSNRPLAGLI
ncbi:peroxisomal copper amine oxidase [Purpureocillium lavendulum]|uniref:Peroxisomal copper amine oxidase n=1 Tax=Purpureocillium lavendulum TaxID=1247861 RepID=A0AB34FF90_9HYPO|nr:peroxisomal copper amine oxidase [Purpureocillium lavendulum]